MLPKLYPILDAGTLARADISLETAARALHRAGARWVQYRDKPASDAEFLERMHVLRTIFPAGEAVLLLNDRVHLCAAAEADGVHIGQQDMDPAEARELIGRDRILGISTHTAAQFQEALTTGTPDYLAIGPVFATNSKENPDPVVGLEGVAAARALSKLPLVAIGGITRETGKQVIEAGADAVAVISGLLPSRGEDQGEDMEQRVRDFLAFLR